MSIDERAIERDLQGIASIQSGEPRLREHAADGLLELHNENWCEGTPISRPEFVSRLTIEAIFVDFDGSVSVCYDDGDLFWGHFVHVNLGADLKHEYSEFVG